MDTICRFAHISRYFYIYSLLNIWPSLEIRFIFSFSLSTRLEMFAYVSGTVCLSWFSFFPIEYRPVTHTYRPGKSRSWRWPQKC